VTTPAEDDPVAAKRALRARVVAARDSLTAEDRAERSAAIATRFTALREAQAARVLLCFVTFGSEVDTSPIIDWALTRGKTVAAPRIVAPRTMVAHRITEPARDLEEGKYGILAPRPDLPLVDPEDFDLVIVPGSVFSIDGGRVGYGGGFYDTYLAQAANARRVALAFELQLVDSLRCEIHDVPTQVIVTEQRVIRPPEQR
jgi:5-formyltetrahydrofolate cyclo-ligase